MLTLIYLNIEYTESTEIFTFVFLRELSVLRGEKSLPHHLSYSFL